MSKSFNLFRSYFPFSPLLSISSIRISYFFSLVLFLLSSLALLPPGSARAEAAATPDATLVERVAVIAWWARAHGLVVLDSALSAHATHRLSVVVARILAGVGVAGLVVGTVVVVLTLSALARH